MFVKIIKYSLIILLVSSSAGIFGADTTFGPATTILGPDIHESKIDAIDMDQDGYVDIIRSFSWEKNNGATSPAFSNTADFGGNIRMTEDLNHDGSVDIIGYWGSDGLCWFESQGNPPAFTKHIIGKDLNLYVFSAADFDNDGDIDVIGYDNIKYNLHMLRSSGGAQPVFSDSVISTFTAKCGYLSIGDLDNDSDNDIIVAIFDKDSSVYDTYWLENDITMFPQFNVHTVSGRSGTVSIADFNRDGRPDVLWGGTGARMTEPSHPALSSTNCLIVYVIQPPAISMETAGWILRRSDGHRHCLQTWFTGLRMTVSRTLRSRSTISPQSGNILALLRRPNF